MAGQILRDDQFYGGTGEVPTIQKPAQQQVVKPVITQSVPKPTTTPKATTPLSVTSPVTPQKPIAQYNAFGTQAEQKQTTTPTFLSERNNVLAQGFVSK